MITELDKTFLRRAMRLAMNGRGHTEPNPSVGCVLVKHGQTIGEGWTQAYGGAHAEPTALADSKARGNDPAGATAYVTLEPCCHTNKKTPPCVPRLIEAKIARVVIGCLDPNPDVNGKGVAMLREAGIEAECLHHGGGDGELDASHFQQLIAPFTKRVRQALPYVTMKWAESEDRKVAGAEGVRMQISNTLSQQIVHQLRSRCDAVVVGAATVLADDPLLTARIENAPRVPDRVVIDRAACIPLTAKLVTTAQEAPTVLVVDKRARVSREKVFSLFAAGVRLVWPEEDNDFLRAALMSGDSIDRGYAHVLVESGRRLAGSLFAAGLVDRVWVFRSAMRVNAATAPSATDVPSHFTPVGTLDLAGDVLTEYLNTQSPAFFAPVPSADFVLAQEQAANA